MTNKFKKLFEVNEASFPKTANLKNIKKKLDSGEWKVISHHRWKKKKRSTLTVRDIKTNKNFQLKVNEQDDVMIFSPKKVKKKK